MIEWAKVLVAAIVMVWGLSYMIRDIVFKELFKQFEHEKWWYQETWRRIDSVIDDLRVIRKALKIENEAEKGLREMKEESQKLEK